MGYLLSQMFWYMLGAFLLGLLLGWLLWGRLRAQIGDLQAEIARIGAERDRLKAELDACGRARADLERRVRELEAELAALRERLARPAPAPVAAPARLISTPAPKPAPKPAPVAKPAPAKKDDLRRLIGIGPVNERLLNKQGVTTYAQIAAWTRADIEKVEQVLQFDGRIDRERWIEQAKYLAAGDEAGFLKAFPNADSDNNT